MVRWVNTAGLRPICGFSYSYMTANRLNQAIQYLKKGSRDQARKLLILEVKENPSNIKAWVWALEVARDEKEKRAILHRILSLDPTHQGALQYLKKLDQNQTALSETEAEVSTQQDRLPKPSEERKPSWILGLARLLIDWLGSLSASCLIFALFIVGLIGLFLYYRVNTSFFGLVGTNYNDLVISNSYQLISTDEMYWEVQFEGSGESKYIGTVRHAAPIRIKEFPILSHDILVTTADFANPDIVETNVVDHKFFWKSPNVSSPNGTINLIHAIPANQEIYEVMLEIQKWDTVKMTGREIYNLKAYQADGTLLGSWQDMGCNTMLIESISLLKADSFD